MSFREIISKLKPTRNETPSDDGGIIYGLWLFIVPVLMGMSLGFLADAGIGYFLGNFSGNNGMVNEISAGTNSGNNQSMEHRGLDEFLASNPFNISPRKDDTPPPPPVKAVSDDKPKEPDTAFDEIVLRGTLPGIGAWFDVKNELKLILVGKNIDSYKLISVNYGDVLFRKGRDKKTLKKYIVYGPGIEAKKPAQPAATRKSATKPAPEPPKQTGNIVAAVPGTQEGQVPSEMVSNLVQNPFDELKRIRMRPNEKAGGLEVQWIQNDSLLKRLGVQRGDVIKSVNGIPFTNMGDIANSINSLMNSERFDVEVTRGGENTALRYVVK